MIVKNEEALLERCLESVKGADAIYILDTGSQDRTIEIARRYTDNVFLDFIWIDDFAKAQNHIKSKVKEEWILSIDADEFLTVPFEEVRKAVALAKDTVRVTMMAEQGEGKNDFGFPRIFRNTPEIRWEQAIHKHLNIPGEGEDVGNISIVYGHSPAHNLDPDRSLRMLENTVRNETNPVRNLYYLGREYWYKERYQDAIDTLKYYVSVGHWAAEVADAYLIMAEAYLKLEQIELCAAACLQAIKINSNFKEAIQFMAAIATDENRKQWERMAMTANNHGVLWERVPAEPKINAIFLAPHNDDEVLFGAFTLIREKPLVIIVTDSYIQPERGDKGCTAEIRRQETINAMSLIGCSVVFLGIKDTELTDKILVDRLKPFDPELIYAPAIQGGNVQHDIVGRVAKNLFGGKCKYYCTYTKTELYTTGMVEIKPTTNELYQKEGMLSCYQSQINLKSTRPHFDAVLGKSEWLTSIYKKVLICPYFGDVPEWMNQFTDNLPAGYDIIFDTDLEAFKKRVKDKLGIDYPGLLGTGKVWDYRAALGLLYEDHITEYDFWGHCDFDMVFGDVNKWFDDETLSKLDIWSNHHEYICGPWTLYRNCESVNKLFMQFHLWKSRMVFPKTNGWVENEFSRLVERSGLRYKYSFMQGDPYHPPFNLTKVDGKLFQDGTEIPMLHFRHDKRWPLAT
jgi:glycosyltransferase involved in cell wall biosynthesis/LmbE family N-acetylglucosaminyl deacetylase